MEQFKIKVVDHTLLVTAKDDETFELHLEDKYYGNIRSVTDPDIGNSWVSDDVKSQEVVNFIGGLIEARYL